MLRRVAFHPLLFALYPILFLLARNLEGQASWRSALASLAVVLAVTTAILLALWAAMKSLPRAAVAVSGYVLLFFSYGHVRDAVFGSGGGSLLLFFWLLLAAVATILAARARGTLETPTLVLNASSVILVLMNLVPVALHAVGGPEQPSVAVASELGLPADPEVAPGGKRDIYYIVFDRYANEETLARRFDFDNEEILSFLGDRGFYVAHGSAANYPRTGHSLASSLNLTLLAHLEDEEGSATADWGAIHRLLKDAQLTRYLRSIGYRYHHIGSWWSPTAETPMADENHVFDAPSEFSTALLGSTLWPEITERLGLEESFGRRATERRRVAYQLDALLSVADDPEPTFTLAHFLIPHPPFVFDRNGEPVTDEIVAERGARESYVEQLLYTNRVIEKIVTELLDGTAEDPIIIIQSDEGPHPPRLKRLERSFNWFEATDGELRQKLLILNAYYFPDGHDDGLYETISPVNSFRLMLNEYFGAGLDLLEDDVYVYRDFHHPYDFMEVTDRLDGKSAGGGD